MYYKIEELNWEEIIIYLRKSRSDSPDESVEEVLAKHEEMLQQKAEAEFGKRIPEDRIFREVVSGETIDERPVMKEVMRRIEDPKIKAIMVVDPQRLSRGDLEDCGRVVNNCRYTNTKVFTLQMTYDLTNKMHRKFFEQELMRGNDYLEYTKEILLRGRILSIEKGNYIGNIAPFGYDKAMIDDCPSLKPNENADAVRLAFDLYVNEGKTYLQIARHLDSLGVKPMNGDKWEKSSIRVMLKNLHYIGMVYFGKNKTEKVFENGKLKKKRGIPADKEEIVIAKGKHEAIVSQEIFQAAQERMNNNPRAKIGYDLQNPFAGIMLCHKCGRSMAQHPYKHAKTRIECRHRKYGCDTKSQTLENVVENVAFALENEKLPELEAKQKNNDGLSANIFKVQMDKMQKELYELEKQEDKQFELLEKGLYSEVVFKKRNGELHKEMEAIRSKMFDMKQTMPKNIDYAEKIVKLKEAIAALKNPEVSAEEKNKLLKAIVEKIEYEYIEYKGKGKVVYKLHIFLLL